jgi:hypothetical protein
VNPFDASSDPQRHAIWDRLVRADCEAFIAGDWGMIEDDFDAEHFEGVRCQNSANPDDWRIAFPDLAGYRDSWLAASKQFAARKFAGGVTPREAIFARTHLNTIDITGDRALCHKKFHGVVPLADASVLVDARQSLFRLHRRADSRWGWRIVGFLGQLPLSDC